MKTSHILATVAVVACIVGIVVYQRNSVENTPFKAIVETESGYRVTLNSVGAGRSIHTIKILRQLSPGVSLTDAKNMVENTPAVVRNSVSEDDAYYIKQALESVGAIVVVARTE